MKNWRGTESKLNIIVASIVSTLAL